ncbi:MAG: ribosome recycling factor [Oligoflexia bacterium]|nr:ribosome recycling factor [Oligoflexia bacterium]
MPVQLSKFKDQCVKAVEHFKKELGRVRSGRASTSLLEGVMVDYYGSQVPLIQVGLINAPEARLLTIQVYDGSAVEAVEKAIQKSELGLNPSREGNLVRVVIPALNEERRKELIKTLHRMTEEARVSLRNHRRDQIDELKKQEKSKEISSDELHRGQDEVQKITDKATADVEALLHAKEKEMMEV